MVLNRRNMLQASIAALALGLPGCTNGKVTTVIFANGTNKIITKIDVFATLNGVVKEYAWAPAVAPGKYSHQGDFPTPKKLDGTTAPLKGTLKVGAAVVAINAASKLVVTLGRTNTYTVKKVGAVFKITVTVSNS